mgnify:CR=1 FL=1
MYSFKQKRAIIELNTSYIKREGTEAIFNNPGTSGGYIKIAEKLSFTNDVKNIGINTVYEHSRNNKILSANVSFCVNQQDMNYLSPVRNIEYTSGTTLASINGNVSYKKFIINGKLEYRNHHVFNSQHRFQDVVPNSGIKNMLDQMLLFYTSSYQIFSPSFKVSMPVSDYWMYLKIAGTFTKFTSANTLAAQQYLATVGITF